MKHQKTKRSVTKTADTTARYEKIFVVMSMLFFTVFPFVSRLVVQKVSSEEEVFFSTQNGYISDITLYSKEIAIAAFAAIAVLFFIAERIFVDAPEKFDKEAFKKLKVSLILIGVMTVFASLSFIFSSNREVAFRGVYTEYEGFLAIISYIFVFIFGLYYMRKDDCVEFFKYFVMIVSIITGVLCAVELLWKPILEFRFVQHLLSPEKYYELAESIESKYFVGQSALFFNNPGFLGGFAGLLLPIDISFVLEASSKKRRILGIVASALICIALYGSNSRAAWIADLVCIAVMIVLWIRKENNKKYGMIISGITIIACAVMFLITSLTVKAKVDDSQIYESGPSAEASRLFRLDSAVLNDGVLEFKSGDDTLVCSVDFEKLYEYMSRSYSEDRYTDCIIVSDGEKVITGRKRSVFINERLDMRLEGFAPDDERFDMITIVTEGQMVYFCFGYDGPAQFAMTEIGFRSFAQGDILEDSIPQPAVTGLESIYRFATGRGYIWAQSLPVIAGSLFIGKGCGNFPFYFRQNELVGLLNTHGSMKFVIDRPHNWYIQALISNGLPYLLCMLVLFAITVFRGIGLAIKKKLGTFESGLVFGVLAFMIIGLINDSCVTVNPVFWMVFGVTARRVLCRKETA